jgi:uncharacterized glyoxalase superfamily protein PhnB
MQRITPYLLYEDCAGALEFLTKAFGFEESLRYEDHGTINHAEMRVGGDSSIMMGNPGKDFEGPKRGGYPGSQVYIYVDDVDAHFERAKAAGAEIVNEPEDQFYGDRCYNAKDPEGHRWTFARQVKQLKPEDWGATAPSPR